MNYRDKCNHCPFLETDRPDRPCAGQRSKLVCERADPRSPKYDPEFLPHILAYVPRGPIVPSAKETMALIRRIKLCPSWERDLTCGCGLDRCSEGKGKAGVISQLDCIACLREKDRSAS